MVQPTSDTHLNATSAALLGLLAIEGWPRPWTSYELAKQGQRSLHWFWPRAERQLYNVPKKLVEQGYAQAHEHRTGKRIGTRYTITEDGRVALRTWLAESGQEGMLIEAEELIRVFFADGTTVDDLRTTLHRIAERADSDRAELGQAAADMDDHALDGRANVNALSIRLISDIQAAVQRWSHWAIEQTASWDTVHDPWDGAAQAFRDVITAGAEADRRREQAEERLEQCLPS